MLPTGHFQWMLLKTPLKFTEITEPPDAQVPANQISLYAKDRSSVSGLFFKDDAGVEHDLSAITTAAALTRVNDTNVTLTLGGSPTIALLAATSLTLGWTGQLAASRGGTGVSSLATVTAASNKITLAGTPTAAVIQAFSIDVAEANLDHGSIGGLTDDDHTQYVLRSILTTNGDLFTRTAGVIARLGVGSEGQVLTVTSGLPAWADAAAGSGESGGGGHLHGLTRLAGDGSTATFNLLDIAEYIEAVINDGLSEDPLLYTLSADGAQVVFTNTPLDGNVLEFKYVVRSL